MDTFFRGTVFTSTGLIAGLFSQLFGGFDMLLQTLLLFMAVDFISGIVSAFIFKQLSSSAGTKGFFKKGSCLLLIVVAVHLDALLGTNGITRDAVIIAFCANELISILENMGKIGIKMPEPILNALEILGKK